MSLRLLFFGAREQGIKAESDPSFVLFSSEKSYVFLNFCTPHRFEFQRFVSPFKSVALF